MKFMMVPLAVLVMGQLITSCAQKTTPVKQVTREPDAEETPWTTWSKKGTVGGALVLKRIREDLLEKNLHDPHVDYSGYRSIDCSKEQTQFRSADGTCTDLRSAHVGAAGVAFGRNVAPEYIDVDAKEKLMEPNPIQISKEFFTREEFKPVPFLNMLAASWIQFMNHDWLTHGKNMEKNPHTVSHGDSQRTIERTKENNNSSEYKRDFGKTTLNDVTHWWDGSQIYGSSQEEQNKVRSFSKGKMSTVMVNGRELLPKNNELNIMNNRQNQGHEVTGFRDNFWVGLSMLHHLFVKEHNYIADLVYKKHVTYDAKTQKYTWKNGKDVKVLDEKGIDAQVFGVARLINSAVMAKIHTVEWTPAILPNNVLKMGMFANWYGLGNPASWGKVFRKLPWLNKADWGTGVNSAVVAGIVGGKVNDYGVPFSITEEFTSVYRLHSLLPEEINLRRYSSKTKVEPIKFEDTRNEKSYQVMSNYDMKDLFYSFGVQNPGQLVLNNFPKFMQELKIPGMGNMDLAMVDIVRDRERGVPRYNQFRRAIGLKPIHKYTDFFPSDKQLDDRQKGIVAKFKKVYGVDDNGDDNVEAIDLLVGTLAEEVRPKGFGFGETQFQIFILMASRRLMADRFYTDYYTDEYYTKTGLDHIDEEGWLHKVIIRHMPELKPHLKGVETAFNPWKP